jgi:hypothetical protein
MNLLRERCRELSVPFSSYGTSPLQFYNLLYPFKIHQKLTPSLFSLMLGISQSPSEEAPFPSA